MTGIPLIRTGDGRLYQRIRRALDEADEEIGPCWIYDQIDALVACTCQLLDRLPEGREREDHAALCALLLKKRALRFAAND
jgi:hypothetical protein